MPRILRTRDVANLLNITPRRVIDLAAAGVIKSYRPKGLRQYIFFIEDVAKYMGVPVAKL